jgi:hypothetical protein
VIPSYANPQDLNRYSYVNNNPLRYTDPTGHRRVGDDNLEKNKASLSCSKNSQYCKNGKPMTKEALKEVWDKRRNQQKKNDSNGYDTPDIPGQCDRPHCYDERKYLDSDGLFDIKLKPWEEIDKTDLTVDVLGIVGDVALTLGGPPGAVFWFFTEIPEVMTISRSFDQLDSGDSSAGLDIAVNIVATIADVERISPWAGAVGNVISIGLNVFDITPVMP